MWKRIERIYREIGGFGDFAGGVAAILVVVGFIAGGLTWLATRAAQLPTDQRVVIIIVVSILAGLAMLVVVAVSSYWIGHRRAVVLVTAPDPSTQEAPQVLAQQSIEEPSQQPPAQPEIPVVVNTEPAWVKGRLILKHKPEYIISLYKFRSSVSIQPNLVEPYLRRWIVVRGVISEIHQNVEAGTHQILCTDAASVLRKFKMEFATEEWGDAIVMLSRGELIQVLGQIKDVGYSNLDLENCELVTVAHEA